MNSVSFYSYGLFAVVSVLATSLPACCKSEPTATAGCSKDSDCKGHRICRGGECSEPAVSTPEPTDSPEPPAPAQTAPPAQNPVPVDPFAMASDGLPAVIPPPGSRVPKLNEWNAVPREITVRHSTPLGCETKMVREWLRVSCRTKDGRDPFEMAHSHQEGQQAYLFNNDAVASVVVQVVPGKEYQAEYTYQIGAKHGSSTLVVKWPAGAPRPSIYFTDP
jgi:hypothetical protein